MTAHACGDAEGTDAGYQRHQRANEQPCPPCKQAHSKAMLDYQQAIKPHNAAQRRFQRAAATWMRQHHPEAAEELARSVGYVRKRGAPLVKSR